MLIEKFTVPAAELEDLGLEAIEMKRLGRIVAIAGKNGAGKSRLLNALERSVGTRASLLPSLEGYKNNVRSYKSALEQQPTSPSVADWQRGYEDSQRQVDLATARIVSAEGVGAFTAVRFVPKQLNLEDPRLQPRAQVVSRSVQARSPGLGGQHASCLFYVHHVQDRWWNASHQQYMGSEASKDEAFAAYEGLQTTIEGLFGVRIGRNLDGEPTLFDKPIADAGLSDGQKVLLQLGVALHAQHGSLDNTVFLLDEPENHLHPSAVIDIVRAIYEGTETSQIWIATHSVPLLAYVASLDPMCLWYADGGCITHAGRRPQIVLSSLLGDGERLAQLNAFTGLPAQLAAINYATESLFPPKVIEGVGPDPQVSQIHRLLREMWNTSPVSVLDIGAGKGRLLDGMAAELASRASVVRETFDYFAFEPFPSERQQCERVISTHFLDARRRYFTSPDDFFGCKDDGSISVAVMCNVLHEIPPHDWPDLFAPESLLSRAVSDNGFLLIVEDQRIPVGEKAHQYGFLVLDTGHLRTLFGVSENDERAGLFVSDDARVDGRLKAHLIGKSLFARVTTQTRDTAIRQLKETARGQIKALKEMPPTYANGQLNGFWTQQFANASLFLGAA